MEILQGQDYIIELELTDSNDIILNPNDLADYMVFVYAEIFGQKQLQQSFKKTDLTVNGSKIKVIIPRTYTAIAPVAKHFIEVKIKQSSGAEFINSEFATGVTDLFIGKIVKSAHPKGLL
jgi:hypothetical protein